MFENLLSSVGGVSKSRGDSVGDVSGLNGLTGGLGDLVLNVGTGDLGDGVAVLDLDGDKLDLGVVNTVLGGDLSAGVLDVGGHRVGDSVGNRGDSSNRGSSEGSGSVRESSKVLSISLSISFSFGLSFTLANGMDSRGITEDINNLLADLLVLNFLGFNSLSGADIFGRGCADLGNENLLFSHTVGSRDGGHNRGGVRASKELRVSLGISLSLRPGGSSSKSKEARDDKNLHLV